MGLDWLLPYREQHSLHLPIMYNAQSAFSRFRLGRAFRVLPPLYIVIDRNGVIRHRSWGQGSISIGAVAGLIEELLEE